MYDICGCPLLLSGMDGGRSSIGRASACGADCCGFEPRRSPKTPNGPFVGSFGILVIVGLNLLPRVGRSEQGER